MSDTEPEIFAAPDGFKESRWGDYRAFAQDLALHLLTEIMRDGFTERQAGSVAAHVLLETAWACAACGAMSEGLNPNPERFIAAARDAIERVRIPTAGLTETPAKELAE